MFALQIDREKEKYCKLHFRTFTLNIIFLFVIIAFHFLILMEHNEKAQSLSLGQWSQLFMQEHN